MRLSPRQAVHHLVARGLVDPGDIVAGRLEVRDVSARNANLAVRGCARASYLLKQAVDGDTAATLRHEAEVYGLLHGDGTAELRRTLPRLFGFDARRRLLVLAFLPGEDLRLLVRRLGRMPAPVARAVGCGLAPIHAFGAGGPAPRARFTPGAPWVFRLPRPPLEWLPILSAANRRFLAVLQDCAPVCDALEQLGREWSREAFLHQDLRWSNVVVAGARRDRPASRPRVAFVDWEFGGWGDPAWDVGCFLSEFLSAWVFSMAFDRAGPTPAAARLARPRLSELQPALRAFWSAYARSRGLARGPANALLTRAVRHAGARLVQTVYETLQAAGELPGHAVWMLQLASHLLERPAEAAVRLLGIPLEPPPTATLRRGSTDSVTPVRTVAPAP